MVIQVSVFDWLVGYLCMHIHFFFFFLFLFNDNLIVGRKIIRVRNLKCEIIGIIWD